MSLDKTVSEVMAGLSEERIRFYNSLILDKLSGREVDNLFSSYSAVREEFLKLVDDGIINCSDNISESVSIMRALNPEKMDYGNPEHVYAVFYLAEQAVSGDFEYFYSIDKKGNQVMNSEEQLFNPMREKIKEEIVRKNIGEASFSIIKISDEEDVKKKLSNILGEYYE